MPAEETRFILVTGASTGIGKSCVAYLDTRGYHVFAGVRRAEDGSRLRDEISDRVEPVLLDVTEPEGIAAAAARITETAGRAGLRGLVNNAGIVEAGPLEYLPSEALRRQFEVNVTGQMAVTRAFLPLIRAGQGRIVFMGSSSGYLAFPLMGPYAASKHAIEALADALRVELRRWRIPVSVIEPGAIATPIWEKSKEHAEATAALYPPEAEEQYAFLLERARRQTAKMVEAAIPPETVARAVFHALIAPRPRLRYPVGIDARLQWVLGRCVPGRLRDWLVALALGI
jgi:NAD(P)-dependent dehydrogenase (short-subunit alcohol dehydrogenase family)